MENEQLFKWFFVAIFVITISISSYFRYRAHQTSEVIPRVREGKSNLLLRLLFAIPLYLSILAYTLNPDWMAWSSIPLPAWMRWLGAMVGLGMLPMLCWVVRSLGKNISETFLTKESHELIRHGPYRWVRHPFYAVATIEFISLSILAANWFMLVTVCLIILGICLLVIPREEAELIRKFGAEYRKYMRHTGKLVPRLRVFNSLELGDS